MHHTATKIATVLLAYGIASAHAGDVNVGVSIAGEVAPGVYGRVDIGNHPPPVVYAQPMIIVKSVRPVAMAPVYMHVPPGHAKKWSKHCHRYNACAHPVYFVKSVEYEPSHQGGRGDKDRKHHKEHKEKKQHKHGRD